MKLSHVEMPQRMSRAVCRSCRAVLTTSADRPEDETRRIRLHAALHINGPKRVYFSLSTLLVVPFGEKDEFVRGRRSVRNPLFRK